MATATLVVVIVLGVPGVVLLWILGRATVALVEREAQIVTSLNALSEAIISLQTNTDSIRDVLTKASAIKAQKQDSVFDRDTITPTNQKPRYVSLAIRRAQAERASLGPVTHDDRVRENNARAIESAG